MSEEPATPAGTLGLTPYQQQVAVVPLAYDLLLGGGRGGGKSFGLASLQVRHAQEYGARAKMLFVRQNYRGMRDFELIQHELFNSVYGRDAKYNGSDYFWRLPGGATIQNDQYENRADYAKYYRKSFTMIMVDKAGEYSDPSLFDLLRSCLRAPIGLTPRFVMAANPGGAGHGLLCKRHVFRAPARTPYVSEGGRTFVNCLSTYRENPHLDQDGYRKQLEAATSTDPELGRAWIDADWTVARGAFFSAVLDEKRNMTEAWAPKRVPGWGMFLAHDYGQSAPSVTYVVGRAPGGIGPDGRAYARGSLVLLDELATNEPGSLSKGMGYTIPILADRIKVLAAAWGIPPEGVADDAIFGRNGTAEGSHAEEYRKGGVFFTPAHKGRRATGWEVMRRLLQDAGKLDRPGLYVSRRCEYWWDTVPNLPRDPRQPDDVDSRAADHGADASRYACTHVPWIPSTRPTIGLY